MTIRRSGGASWSTSTSGQPQLHWPHSRASLVRRPVLSSISALPSVTYPRSSITRRPGLVNGRIRINFRHFRHHAIKDHAVNREKFPPPVYQYPHEVSPIPQPRFTGLCRRVRVFAGGPPPRASRRVRDGDGDEDGDGDDLAHQAADAAPLSPAAPATNPSVRSTTSGSSSSTSVARSPARAAPKKASITARCAASPASGACAPDALTR